MFATRSNPLTAYSKISVETSVNTASPHQLIVLLFDGAISAIKIAKEAMNSNQVELRGTSISKAIDIIRNGLQVSVSTEQGGDLAEKLIALYEYMTRRLLHANLKNDKGALTEVENLLDELRSAWVQIAEHSPTNQHD